MTPPSRRPDAVELDRTDPLASFRDRFHLIPGQIYLDGNSLGLCSLDAEQAALGALRDWKLQGIGGWLSGDPPWFSLAETLGEQMATLAGAHPDEVIVTNSTTVNLHQLLSTLYRPAGRRTKILADALAFPSDLYALKSHLALRGRPESDLVLGSTSDGRTLDDEALMECMTDEIGLAILPSVIYTSGQLLDMHRLTAAAHAAGVLIGFDCSHSIGALPHHLSAWNADFAFWCGYKYLNGGPGSAAGLYLNRRHFEHVPGLAGWFSSAKDLQFDMSPDLTPAYGAARLQIGTPNILSMAPLIGSVKLVLEAGIDRIREKSLLLTDFMIERVDSELSHQGLTLVTPRERPRRGGHIALVHPEAPRICKALKAWGVIPDFRPPDIVRLGPSPLYTRFEDCDEALTRLVRIMAEKAYLAFPAGRDRVA